MQSPLADPEVEERGSELLTQLVLGELQDPFPIYEELRELGGGVHYSKELGAYFMSRSSDLQFMGENNPSLYSNDMAELSGANDYDPSDPNQARYGQVAKNFLFFLDPPTHTQVRGVFRNAFTPRQIKKWRGTVEKIADDLLAEFDHGDEVDFMERLAAKIPIEVIASILGVPPEDFPMFAEWTEALMKALDPAVLGEERAESIRFGVGLVDYMEEIAKERRRNPKDDLISLLVNTPVEDTGAALDLEMAVSQAVILLVAGNDTTTHLIGGGMKILMDRPEDKARLAQDAASIPKAVEEMLRFDPPFHLDFRRIARDHVVGGREVQADTMMFQIIAAANRDPREFPNPQEYDIDRANKRHHSFSHGIHHCVGAPLARLESLVAFERILKAFPNTTFGSSEPVRKTNIVARGWKHLPVVLKK